MEPLKEACPTCRGTGLVARERRRLANGEPDAADFRRHDLCTRCGGSGKVAVDMKAIEERKPGFLVDAI